MRLPKQRWAFPAEIMSIITVMDKSTKSSCRVKYPTEKDHPRGAALNLLFSRGTWVSESPKALKNNYLRDQPKTDTIATLNSFVIAETNRARAASQLCSFINSAEHLPWISRPPDPKSSVISTE
jgi:hypothetical protein